MKWPGRWVAVAREMVALRRWVAGTIGLTDRELILVAGDVPHAIGYRREEAVRTTPSRKVRDRLEESPRSDSADCVPVLPVEANRMVASTRTRRRRLETSLGTSPADLRRRIHPEELDEDLRAAARGAPTFPAKGRCRPSARRFASQRS